MLLDKKVSSLAENLVAFMQQKFGFDKLPVITYVDDEQNAGNLLCKTGQYDHENESITIYITGRHPKDILRSLAHELLHHIQKHEGMMDNRNMGATSNPNYILYDKFLKKVEADAFERGNICFREWEANIKEGLKKMENLEEKKKKKRKIPKKKLSKYKMKVKKIADTIKKDQPNISDEKKFRIASAAAKKAVGVKGETLSENKKPEEQKEVVINDALKNSLYYVKEDRALADAYERRDEKVYNELLRKFGIKK